MDKRRINILIALLLMAALYFFILRSPDQKSGKAAPNFQTQLIDGQSFELNQLKGHYVLLDFWASWCAPCRRENPKLVQLYKTFNGRSFANAEGFEVVSIALERNDKTWKRAAEKDGFIWPYQIVQEARVVLLSSLAQKYAVSEIPAKFLISPEGTIIGVNQNYDEIGGFLESKLSES